MIIKVSHIGIAVNSIDAMLKLYIEALGLKLAGTEVLADQKVKTAIIPVGESKIELLESTDPEGPIAKFIEKKGEGLHHIALEVPDIRAALAELKKKNIPLIDIEPRRGVENTTIAFLHPKESKILLELVEAKK
ncbi:MAG: methylmalonyl-CoA epimerase [Dehalococcoidales bacterium]|nr:methylmalonyl-CoA epimerase [Dehalococcoidales bacterium]